jgi:hypothetical protein
MKKKQHGSRILREIHESAKALHQSGVIGKASMEEFDALAKGFADQLANMPNVGEDRDFAREQTPPDHRVARGPRGPTLE